jgi:hypothetical protein
VSHKKYFPTIVIYLKNYAIFAKSKFDNSKNYIRASITSN